jgi:hypothetical protein
VLRRSTVLIGAGLAALALTSSALALTVHVRVEGATQTIFGAPEPTLSVYTGTLGVDGGPPLALTEPTALGALEAASRAGEFYYRLRSFSFGPYVDQIGRYAGTGTSGWVYKVDGVSPPVGAADYVVKEGDTVLWYYANFGESGGPPTLELETTSDGSTRCYRAVTRDDAGKATYAAGVVYVVDGRRRASGNGRLCPSGKWTKLRVTKAGAVPSRVVFRAR